MRDPHVETLFYNISSNERISYKDPKPIKFNNHLAEFELADEHLVINLKEHFPDEESARKAVEHYLTSWEINADLTLEIGAIRFLFDKSKIIDRNPPKPGETITIHAKAAEYVVVGNNAKIHLQRAEYPEPPLKFSTTSTVETGYRRWIGYKEGKEPLQAMSYFVLTLIQDLASSRDDAASMYKIEKSILKKLGELSST